MIITIPGIVITMIPESLLRSFRNAHHDHFGIAITLPRNPHSAKSGEARARKRAPTRAERSRSANAAIGFEGDTVTRRLAYARSLLSTAVLMGLLFVCAGRVN